jgi:hypothetical protein
MAVKNLVVIAAMALVSLATIASSAPIDIDQISGDDGGLTLYCDMSTPEVPTCPSDFICTEKAADGMTLAAGQGVCVAPKWAVPGANSEK